MLRVYLPLILFILAVNTCFGQTNEAKIELSLEVGKTLFIGDLEAPDARGVIRDMKQLYGISLTKRIHPNFGISLNGSYAALGQNEAYRKNYTPLNFNSTLYQAGIGIGIYFDEAFSQEKIKKSGPFIETGLQYVQFQSLGDHFDENNNRYYYWSDGSIRNLSESNPDATGAEILQRDYNFETPLTDSINKYPLNTLNIPITLGWNYKVSQVIHFKFAATYNMLLSDWIDNSSKNSGNDSYLGFKAGITYRFLKDKVEASVKKVDFEALESADADSDGILDLDDACPRTPGGIPVDEKGCPLDADKDGVPDHLDQEPNTPPNVVVDEVGRELTPEMLQAREDKINHSTTERHAVFSENTSFETLEKISKDIEQTTTVKSKIPNDLQIADLDNNGLISAAEITAAIDGFFDGSNTFTVKKLHELIDYFFEQ